MDAITLGQISSVLTFIAGIITAGGVVYAFGSKMAEKHLKMALAGTNEKLDRLAEKIDGNTLDNCKNYIVEYLAIFDHNKTPSVEETERFWENYDTYQKMGGNSYIHTRVENLKKQGKL